MFLHRGAMVGGKEVICVRQEGPEMIFTGSLFPHAMEMFCMYAPLVYPYKYNEDCSITPSLTLLEFQLKENTCIPVSYRK